MWCRFFFFFYGVKFGLLSFLVKSVLGDFLNFQCLGLRFHSCRLRRHCGLEVLVCLRDKRRDPCPILHSFRWLEEFSVARRTYRVRLLICTGALTSAAYGFMYTYVHSLRVHLYMYTYVRSLRVHLYMCPLTYVHNPRVHLYMCTYVHSLRIHLYMYTYVHNLRVYVHVSPQLTGVFVHVHLCP